MALPCATCAATSRSISSITSTSLRRRGREFPDQDADVLVVDPPRAGLAPEAIDLIASTSARDVAYVSCDPATLARDLKRFVEEGTFSPVKITPVDLFPQTFHCETVVHLKRN